MTAAKPSSLSIWIFGCLAALAGIWGRALILLGTDEFWEVRIISALFFGTLMAVITLPILCIVFVVIQWSVSRSKLSFTAQRFILLTPWLLFLVYCLSTAAIAATPKSRFSAIVLDPVPDSVKEVKVAGFHSFLARRWLFHFRIDPAQASEIVKKHELTQVPPFDFKEKISHDPDLREVAWARDIRYRDTALFYTRTEDEEDGHSSRWTYLMVDPDSSHAWFIQGYQR